MYIDDQSYIRNGISYRRVLLRHGTRISPTKTKLHTIANISNCTDNEIEALKIALSYKQNISSLKNLANGNAYNGKIYGAVVCLYQVCQQLGICNVFGNKNSCYASLNLWLILARFLGNGSRLSAVRIAQIHAGCELLGIESLTEDDLYAAMDWLYEHKSEIEKKLMTRWKNLPENKQHSNHVFLYDLSSSYLEGTKNELAAFGYNRDNKKGKMIITYGLLTDEDGDPLGIEVFPGNTADNKTVKAQMEKIKHEYKAKYITFVGDKGMIKDDQQRIMSREDLYYITSITKSQMNTLLSNKFIELGLFDEKLCEVEDVEKKIRYILRKNPVRAEEIQLNRKSKIAAIEKMIAKSNTYLSEHTKAKVEVQIKNLTKYIEKLKLIKALKVEPEAKDARKLILKTDTQQLSELSKLDGCYAIKTNLPKDVLDTTKVHQRYKDLALVEQAFKECKSLLNARAIFVRKKERTVAHMVITMFAYKIERHLRKVWKNIDFTPLEGIEMLKQIGSQIISIGKTKQITILKPTGVCKKLLDEAKVIMPSALPYKEIDVHTNRKLPSRRK